MRCGGDAGSVGRDAWFAGRYLTVSEQRPRQGRKALAAYGKTVWVLTPVAGAKMSGGEVSPTGLDQPLIRFFDGDKTNSSPGRARQ